MSKLLAFNAKIQQNKTTLV